MTSAPELQGTFETILSPRGCAPGLKIGTGAARGVKLGGSADFQSISIAQNRCKPRRIFGARLIAAPAAAWPRFQRAAAGSSTTAAVHFGCGLAALRCIAEFHSSTALENPVALRDSDGWPNAFRHTVPTSREKSGLRAVSPRPMRSAKRCGDKSRNHPFPDFQIEFLGDRAAVDGEFQKTA